MEEFDLYLKNFNLSSSDLIGEEYIECLNLFITYKRYQDISFNALKESSSSVISNNLYLKYKDLENRTKGLLDYSILVASKRKSRK